MKLHKVAKRVNSEQGQSLVEFAITLPLLLLLLLGTVDLGMGFKTYIVLTNAAREGARWISINPTDTAGAEAHIGREVADNGLSNANISTDVAFSSAPYEAVDDVTVSLNYTYELVFEYVPGLSSIQIEASTTMVVLHDD